MKNNKELTREELKEVQIKLLDEFHDFCVANKLTYSLAYGTLIGAIRHKGYIPWDDDIDVAMPRPDYNFFIRNYKSKSSQVYCAENNKKCYLCFAQLADNRTIHRKWTIVHDMNIGENIDIFPIDGLPSDSFKAKRHFQLVSLLRKFISAKNTKLSSIDSLYNYIKVLFLKLLLYPVPFRRLVIFTVRKIQKYDYKSSNLAADLTGNSWKSILPKKTFEKVQFAEFEGKRYFVFCEYDTWLKVLFGNYLELPPSSERVSEHEFKTYWK